VKTLNDSSLDLLELSGGSLEQPKIAGLTLMDEGEDAPRESTVKREAFFVDFAASVRAAAKMPVMVVGGFRTTTAMIESLERGELDVIGLGRPIIADPEIPKRILAGEVDRAPSPEAALHPFHLLPWNNMQLERLADGLDSDLSLDGADAVEQFTEIEIRNITALLQHRA
jgi:2,4-dienoyl-CoA reductase-like NADH-dependent reductase (Old Yellow Enzyme family)